MSASIEESSKFGYSDVELRNLESVYRSDLFTGKKIIVSGAGSGLGKAIATLFAKLGADLIICGRNEEKLVNAADYLKSLGGGVSAHVMSIRDPEVVNTFMNDAWAAFGGVDILVNNAGGQFAFNTLKLIVTVGWAIYPIGYFLGYLSGSETTDFGTVNIVYNVADLVNKTAFGLAIWVGATMDSSK